MKEQNKDLTILTRDELLQKNRSLKEQLFKLNQARYAGSVDKPHQFSVIKREIARIQTLLNAQKVKANGQA